MNLAKYRCHKIVNAGEIGFVGAEEYRDGLLGRAITVLQADATPAEKFCGHKMFSRYTPTPGDFFVVYDDGYESISPRQAFLDGYAKIEG